MLAASPRRRARQPRHASTLAPSHPSLPRALPPSRTPDSSARARLARGGGLAAAPNANPNCLRGRYQNLIADPTCRRQQRLSVRARNTATCGVPCPLWRQWVLGACRPAVRQTYSLLPPATCLPDLPPCLSYTSTATTPETDDHARLVGRVSCPSPQPAGRKWEEGAVELDLACGICCRMNRASKTREQAARPFSSST